MLPVDDCEATSDIAQRRMRVRWNEIAYDCVMSAHQHLARRHRFSINQECKAIKLEASAIRIYDASVPSSVTVAKETHRHAESSVYDKGEATSTVFPEANSQRISTAVRNPESILL